MAVMLAAGVTACSSSNDANNAKNEVTTSGVAQQWQLTMIDQQAISAEGSPTLNVNKDMEVNGYTGCNRYFGKAELDNNRFKIDRMASTRMACAENSMALEQTMSQVLGQWSDASGTCYRSLFHDTTIQCQPLSTSAFARVKPISP
ncbi:hypothetical protein BZG79_05945 [Salinivibrio sp. MA427]|nr:hypothetical protein BZG79_05945 [Salinivibrio sp. MA427]